MDKGEERLYEMVRRDAAAMSEAALHIAMKKSVLLAKEKESEARGLEATGKSVELEGDPKTAAQWYKLAHLSWEVARKNYRIAFEFESALQERAGAKQANE